MVSWHPTSLRSEAGRTLPRWPGAPMLHKAMHRLAGAVMALAVAAMPAALTAGPAAAAPAGPGARAGTAAFGPRSTSPWKIQTTKNTTTPGGSLAGVSCVSTSWCVSVGSATNVSGSLTPVAQLWNGTSWVAKAVPEPIGSSESTLQAISCTTMKACTAVGSTRNSAGTTVALVETWNGTAWALGKAANPSGATISTLYGVSCTSATACVAVGSYQPAKSYARDALAESLSGTTWQVRSSPTPTGTTASQLYGVSCGAVAACTAVGYYEDSSGNYFPLADVWNGSAFANQHVTRPSGGSYEYLYAISCRAASCMAVGTYDDGSLPEAALAEQRTGTTWAVKPTPSVGGGWENELTGISCSSGSACTAVGDGGSEVLAETWNGAAWSLASAIAPPSALYGYLTAVSCVASKKCSAVGEWASRARVFLTLAESSSGTTFTMHATPDVDGALSTYVTGVSCASSGSCMAVGYTVAPSTGQEIPYAEKWTSQGGWSGLKAKIPTGTAASKLAAVSCRSATACTAVGTTGGTAPLVETWNGSSWSIVTVPSPSGSTATGLLAVSCVAGTTSTPTGECMAAGNDEPGGSSFEAFTESTTGGAWKVHALANPTNQTVEQVVGVSCATASSCQVVGYYRTGTINSLPLAESWNGTSWTVHSVTLPDPYGTLNAVSCPAASACVAVGQATPSNGVGSENVSGSWNGHSWSSRALPASSGSTTDSLAGISCATSQACTAVGSYYNSSTHRTAPFAEAMTNTTWQLQYPPEPTASTYSTLVADACNSATVCTAIGGHVTPSNKYVTLAEAKGR